LVYWFGTIAVALIAGLALLGFGIWSSVLIARPREERYDRERLG
jgi:hypothetical protein